MFWRPFTTAVHRMNTDKSYKAAIEALNSLQSNASVIASNRANWASIAPLVMPESIEYLSRLGYSPDDLDRINVLHVAGTKGKGSTCAFLSSLLNHTSPDAKIGLYTSPHLVAVRERIRINGVPLSEEKFAAYFWQVWDTFAAHPQRAREETSLMPPYFKYLTMMAFHVFLKEEVDAAIVEVGIGGLYDCTNVVPHPRVALVTALGIDHVALLGNTLPEIAAQKAGIYKPGSPALSTEQPKDALQVLKDRASKVGTCTFSVVGQRSEAVDTTLGIAGKHQISNASLALTAVETFYQSPDLPSVFESAKQEYIAQSKTWQQAVTKGLSSASWPGRCQTVQRGNVTWYVDGAHTAESLAFCADWFSDATSRHKNGTNKKRALIFNCTSGRQGSSLLATLFEALVSHGLADSAADLFQHVYFCPNVTYSGGSSKSDLVNRTVDQSALDVLRHLQTFYDDNQVTLNGRAGKLSQVCGSVEEAVNAITDLKEPIDVLVTGSLHLVGGVTEVAGLTL